MDLFDGRYYRLTKILLSIIGVWPYQGYIRKHFAIALGMSGIFGFLVPQVLYIRKYLDDLDKILQVLPTIITAVLIATKTLTLIVNCAKLKILFNQVHEDWNNVKEASELEVLEKWTDNGQKLVMRYTLLLLTSGLWYYVPPLIAPILDCVVPLNTSRPRSLLHAADYLVDQDEHFSLILLVQYMCNFMVVIAVIGSDSAYILLMYHGCAKYAMVSHRLRSITPSGETEGNIVHYISVIIKSHMHARRYTLLIISMFTTYLFWDTGLGLITHSTSCVMIVIYKNEPSKIIPFVSIGLAQSFRLFLNSWPAQKLMDRSLDVCDAVYESAWYQMLTSTRKLFSFMMMNSQTPYAIRVAKLYVINLDSFGMVMKTSMSYCTVMISVHDLTDSM